MNKYPDYIGQPLADNEYLLKIDPRVGKPDTGFLTKLTKKNLIPKAFEEWGTKHSAIYVFKEDFRKGWKILNWRFGQSQNWATMIHPEGFTVEIYLQDLLIMIKNNTVIDGELQGEFFWKDHTLIKR